MIDNAIIGVTMICLGGIWFMICMSIGVSNPKNKWGPDAVENYCNGNDDRMKMMIWTFYGLFGAIFLGFIGYIIGGFA